MTNPKKQSSEAAIREIRRRIGFGFPAEFVDRFRQPSDFEIRVLRNRRDSCAMAMELMRHFIVDDLDQNTPERKGVGGIVDLDGRTFQGRDVKRSGAASAEGLHGYDMLSFFEQNAPKHRTRSIEIESGEFRHEARGLGRLEIESVFGGDRLHPRVRLQNQSGEIEDRARNASVVDDLLECPDSPIQGLRIRLQSLCMSFIGRMSRSFVAREHRGQRIVARTSQPLGEQATRKRSDFLQRTKCGLFVIGSVDGRFDGAESQLAASFAR